MRAAGRSSQASTPERRQILRLTAAWLARGFAFCCLRLGSRGEIMNFKPFVAATLTAALVFAAPATAQEAAVGGAPVAGAAATCELHVWPTENYLGINMGLLSGFGALGALADMAAHKGKVKTVKDLMAEYLGPQVQMEELEKAGLTQKLKLADYRVVVHEPTPFNEDLKDNPELKAKAAAMNAKLKSKQRMSDSTHPCYAELITTHIFYHKAMMYGSNLFTGWTYREFGDKPTATKVASGQVKNPLEHFPPKDAAQVETAKLELRDAYAKDFAEYVEKKVKP
ncbi:MAG TPA: hypothetical protein VEZ48_12035 [Sphingomonadaceae bacterium]|nr:hypothetical protein [Sphingomonadaceae bacterium]